MPTQPASPHRHVTGPAANSAVLGPAGRHARGGASRSPFAASAVCERYLAHMPHAACGSHSNRCATMTFLPVTETRQQLHRMLDAAGSGVPVGIERGDDRVALIEADRLRELLTTCPLPGWPEAVAEAGGWSVFLPGTPIAAEGADLEEALDEFLLAVREYADDWQERLRRAPDHAANWPLVQLAALSSENELADWARGSTR